MTPLRCSSSRVVEVVTATVWSMGLGLVSCLASRNMVQIGLEIIEIFTILSRSLVITVTDVVQVLGWCGGISIYKTCLCSKFVYFESVICDQLYFVEP